MKNGMRPIHPGEILREEFLEENLLENFNTEKSLNELAALIGMHPQTLKDILEEKRDVTEDIAAVLGDYFVTSTEFWTDTQSTYDERKRNYQSEVDEKDNLLRDKIYECLVKHDICCDLNGNGPSPNDEKFTNEIETIFKEAGFLSVIGR
jgi:antitoxin HigA-1